MERIANDTLVQTNYVKSLPMGDSLELKAKSNFGHTYLKAEWDKLNGLSDEQRRRSEESHLDLLDCVRKNGRERRFEPPTLRSRTRPERPL